MRCLSCNTALNDYESTRKYKNGSYVDLCNYCYRFVKDSINTVDRPELEHINDDIDDNLED